MALLSEYVSEKEGQDKEHNEKILHEVLLPA